MAESDYLSDAYLLLEDGTLFRGEALGAKGTTTGEICFDTAMTGYQEILTDPSFYGQILVMNNIYVGNYGFKEEDATSSNIKVSGLVCKNVTEKYSRKSATSSLQEAMEKDGIVGISGLNTRALASHIRDFGTMKALLSSEGLSVEELRKRLAESPRPEDQNLTASVSTQKTYELEKKDAKWKIAVLDLGVKKNTLNELMNRGGYLGVFPWDTPFAAIAEFQPDAYFISDGPGNPNLLTDVIETTKDIIHSGKPVFGVSLGHQIIALAAGMKVNKMHHGHRGANVPVLNKITGKSEITVQNHGYEIDPLSAKDHVEVEVTHVNLDDQSVEGIRFGSGQVFSVQFNPNGQDSRYLFDEFFEEISWR